MTALVVAEAVVILLLGVLVAGLLRSHADILRRLHELDAGAESAPFQTADGVAPPRATGMKAPDVAGASPDGGISGIRIAASRRPTLLAFMSTTCSTCDHFWPRFELKEIVQTLGDVRLVIITKGAADESPAEVAKLAPKGIPLVMSSAAWRDYQVPGSPYFILVDPASGTVTGEGSASSWDKLLDLMGFAGDDSGVDDRDRAERVDAELADAGIHPGDPQLYGQATPPADSEEPSA